MAIAALAQRQHGHVARKQLLRLGLGPDAIKYRLRTGRLHRVYPGVYGVGHRRPAPIDAAAAAVLACGKGAVLSDFSAAALWGFVKRWPERPEVSVTRDRRPTGIRTRRRDLTAQEKTRQQGIPVTTPARTVLDCARRLHGRRLTRFVNDALLSLFLHRTELIDAVERHPKHPGAARIAPALRAEGGPTKSELEDAFVAFCSRHDLPAPETNVFIDGREVDAFFRAERVIVELDSYEYHSDKTAFERDREKDADAAAKGLITVRVTDQRMTDVPEEEAARLRTILAARGNR
ncbi:MAG TPA: type IV toxin-antitoxin system AbiEi family antitoxin domain-containing protein [Solirubrobacteraceae bacterium]